MGVSGEKGELQCGQDNPYANKQKRFVDFSVLAEGLPIGVPTPGEEISQAEAEALSAEAIKSIIDSCGVECERNADTWMEQLVNCGLSTEDSTAIRQRLIAVCQSGCDVEHPYGASTSPSGDNSFALVLKDYMTTYTFDCNPYLITTLSPYEAYTGPSQINSTTNTCVCEELTKMEASYEVNKETEESFYRYLQQFYSYSLDSLELVILHCLLYTSPSPRD